MTEALIAVIGGIVGGSLSLVAGLVLTKVRTRDNTDTLESSERTETLAHLRWASSLAVSEDEAQRRLGAEHLIVLFKNHRLSEEDAELAMASVKAALGPRLEAWDN